MLLLFQAYELTDMCLTKRSLQVWYPPVPLHRHYDALTLPHALRYAPDLFHNWRMDCSSASGAGMHGGPNQGWCRARWVAREQLQGGLTWLQGMRGRGWGCLQHPRGLDGQQWLWGAHWGRRGDSKASPPVSMSLLQLLEQVIAHFVDENHSLIL